MTLAVSVSGTPSCVGAGGLSVARRGRGKIAHGQQGHIHTWAEGRVHMARAPSDERATSPATGVAVMFVLAVLIAAAVGVGAFTNNEEVTATVQVAATDGGATVLWTDQGTANYIEVTTGNALGNTTITEVGGTAELPKDVGRTGETTLVVRAVNNESDRVIEEQDVELR
ncbi:hypothetical protein JT689_10140 [Halobacterium sp. GSL-19]|nr:hypothetical protein JT689_10140 [Halobacterium sp. GSL-19]